MTIAIALFALLFTISSFWWLNARPGRLVGSRPCEFSMFLDQKGSRFRIPLVIYNTGAWTMVVESLRLSIIGSDASPLEWISTRDRLRPMSDEVMDFSSPFAVDGRRAIKLFAEFGEDEPIWRPHTGSAHQVAVEARLLRSSRWRTVVQFPLAIPTKDLNSYITRRNPAVAGG